MSLAGTYRPSRRVFLKAAAPFAVPFVVPAAAFGASDRVAVGFDYDSVS